MFECGPSFLLLFGISFLSHYIVISLLACLQHIHIVTRCGRQYHDHYSALSSFLFNALLALANSLFFLLPLPPTPPILVSPISTSTSTSTPNSLNFSCLSFRFCCSSSRRSSFLIFFCSFSFSILSAFLLFCASFSCLVSGGGGGGGR